MAQTKLDQGRYGDAVVLANQDLSLDSKFYLAKKIKGIALASMGQVRPGDRASIRSVFSDPFREGVALLYAQTCIWPANTRAR